MENNDEHIRRRFLLEAEQAIRETNKRVIHERIPRLAHDHVISFASTVARLRARYLDAAFNLSSIEESGPIDEKNLQNLKQLRELYEEARLAYDSLIRAIEQGYVDLEPERVLQQA